MRDIDEDGNDVDVFARFFLAFPHSKASALKMMSERHVLNKNSLQYFYS